MSSTDSATRPRLLSGIKPTGRIHIGNYFGALKQFVELQNQYETFVMVANLHALTGGPSRDELVSDTRALVLDYLGAGLDPEKVVLFKQSDVPAHTALTWIFNCLVTVPFLQQAHAFKDAKQKVIEKIKNSGEVDSVVKYFMAGKSFLAGSSDIDDFIDSKINVGTFDYPVLMATDILLYTPDVVPVGKDQKQHVEYAREIATKFNNKYGELFNFPKELIMEEVATVPGTDGQKMSKSYGNTIPLFASDEEIKKAVMSISTDSRAPNEEKNPDELVLYQIHKLFNASAELRSQYAQGLGYGDAKKMLIADIISFVTPMRERRTRYEDNPKLVDEILLKGAMRANDIAMNKLQKVYEASGLIE